MHGTPNIFCGMAKNKSTNLSIRMDLDLKHDAEELFGNLGMNLTTAFNIFVRQSLQVQGLPFSVKLKTSIGNGDEEKESTDTVEKNSGDDRK